MAFIVTNIHLQAAFMLGNREALNAKELGVTEPADNLLETEQDIKDVIFLVTGEKLNPDSEEGWLIIDNYEEGYYSEWY